MNDIDRLSEKLYAAIQLCINSDENDDIEVNDEGELVEVDRGAESMAEAAKSALNDVIREILSLAGTAQR